MRPDPVEVIARARWKKKQALRVLMKRQSDQIAWEDATQNSRDGELQDAAEDYAALKDAGYAVVEVEGVKFLLGEAPNADGKWFGDDDKPHRYWWRADLRAMLRASQEG